MDSQTTWNGSKLRYLPQPWKCFRTWLKQRHHQVGFLLAVSLRVQHPVPIRTGERTARHFLRRCSKHRKLEYKWGICFCVKRFFSKLSYPSWTSATMPSTLRLPCSRTQKFGLLPVIWLAEFSSSVSSGIPVPTSSPSANQTQETSISTCRQKIRHCTDSAEQSRNAKEKKRCLS